MSPKGVLSLLLSPQYEYQYEVKDPEQNLFFDKNEIGDETGKVTDPSAFPIRFPSLPSTIKNHVALWTTAKIEQLYHR